MIKEYLIHKEIFKIEPELQENVFILQRIYETQSFLIKILKGLPKDEETQNCFKSMIKICEEELNKQFQIIGEEVLKIIYDEIYERKNSDDISKTQSRNHDR